VETIKSKGCPGELVEEMQHAGAGVGPIYRTEWTFDGVAAGDRFWIPKVMGVQDP
jgi:hypothetical protein